VFLVGRDQGFCRKLPGNITVIPAIADLFLHDLQIRTKRSVTQDTHPQQSTLNKGVHSVENILQISVTHLCVTLLLMKKIF